MNLDKERLELQQRKLTGNMNTLLDLVDAEQSGKFTAEQDKHYTAWEKDLQQVVTEIKTLQQQEDRQKRQEDRRRDDGVWEALAGGGNLDRLVRLVGRDQKKSLGQQFIESPAGKYLVETKGLRSGTWASPYVELKAVLLEDTLIAPQVLPGIVPSPQPPIVMSELFASGTTNSPLIQYMEETPAPVNAAAPVAEGGVKPESTISFANKTSPVCKIATWLPVSDEFLEDEPGLRSYLDARLRLFVLLELDDQILTGTGVSPELLGMLVRTDLTPPLAAGTSGLDAIATQIAAVEQASQLPVDSVVLNDSDWLKFSLTKTTTGEYIGASPFEQPAAKTLFGRRVATTPKMPAGTALVGSFRTGGGQLFQRGGLNTQASNTHADYFIKNLTAIRAEVRMALVLQRPTAFGTVTGLNPPA